MWNDELFYDDEIANSSAVPPGKHLIRVLTSIANRFAACCSKETYTLIANCILDYGERSIQMPSAALANRYVSMLICIL